MTCDHWFHMDIAGVADNADEVPYLPKGMAGVNFTNILRAAFSRKDP